MAFCLDKERNQAWRRFDHGAAVCAVCCVYLHEIDGQERLEYMTLLMRDQEMIQKGREEGRKEGRIDALKDTAIRMSKKGRSIEEIADCVDSDVETVKKWITARI